MQFSEQIFLREKYLHFDTAYRNPCTAKTDADLPRYGKKWTYVPNIPAVVADGKETECFLSMVPGEMVTLVTEGDDGEQIITQAQIVSSHETVSSQEDVQVLDTFFLHHSILYIC